MRQRLLAGPHRQRGFTLIELLIVIVVLGVLAAVVIMAIGAFEDRGELAACRADVKTVENAVEAYRAKVGRYPDSLDDLTKAPGNYLREVPNTTEGSGKYWIVYDPATGTVTGRVTSSDEVCAGELAMATPGASGTATEPGGPGGGEPGGGNPTTTTTSPAGGTTSTSPGGGSPTTTTAPGGGNPTTTTTAPGGGGTTTAPGGGGNPNPNPTPGQPGTPVVNCFDPPGSIDDIDCLFTWSAPSGPVTRYTWQYVMRFDGSCSASDFGLIWPLQQSGSVTGTSYLMEIAPFPGNYCFRVRAVNGTIDGPWSNPVGFAWFPDWT